MQFTSSTRARIAVALAIAVIAVCAALFVFRKPVAQHIAQSTAQSAFGSRKLNVLLLGYQEDEGNSDTIIAAHLDIDRRIATLVSIPRDSWVSIPGHGYDKINAAIGYGGPRLSAQVVSKLIGAPIDAIVALRPEDAKQLVDAMGGLNVDVDEDMDYDDNAGDLHIHLHKGEQYLNGGQVLGYIRFRHDAASDWGRVRRQQQVLKDLLDQMSTPQQWMKLPHLLSLASKDVKTNLSQAQLAALLQVYRGVPDDNIRTFTMPGRAGWVGDASVVFLDPAWTKIVGKLLFSKQDPPQDAVLVANATGNADLDKTVVAALRGGGWNVPTFVDEPAKRTSRIVGTTAAAQALAGIFPSDSRLLRGSRTVLQLGENEAPQLDP